MANICWFEMRIRGTKENCYAMLNSGFSCYDMRVKAERGTESDYMMYIGGECRWSVTTSMVEVENGDTLAAKAAKFQLELEVCGLDESRESHERFHYIGDKVIKENNLPESLPAWGVESGDFGLSEEALQKYDKNEEQDMYVLREEFVEHFTFDYELDEAVFDFSMSFHDLPECEVEESIEEIIPAEKAMENANVYSESASTAESTMTCPHCNRTINSKDTFCIYCGKVVVTQNNIGDESIESLINRRAETLERINAANAEMLELEQKEQQLLAQTEDLAHQEANLQHAEEKLSRKRNELQQAQTAYRREAEEIGFHAE